MNITNKPPKNLKYRRKLVQLKSHDVLKGQNLFISLSKGKTNKNKTKQKLLIDQKLNSLIVSKATLFELVPETKLTVRDASA